MIMARFSQLKVEVIMIIKLKWGVEKEREKGSIF